MGFASSSSAAEYSGRPKRSRESAAMLEEGVNRSWDARARVSGTRVGAPCPCQLAFFCVKFPDSWVRRREGEGHAIAHTVNPGPDRGSERRRLPPLAMAQPFAFAVRRSPFAVGVAAPVPASGFGRAS